MKRYSLAFWLCFSVGLIHAYGAKYEDAQLRSCFGLGKDGEVSTVWYHSASLDGSVGVSADAREHIIGLSAQNVSIFPILSKEMLQTNATSTENLLVEAMLVCSQHARRLHPDHWLLARPQIAIYNGQIEHANKHLKTGPISYDYRIARFAWELRTIPDHYVDRLNSFDEVWIPSFFHQNSLVSAGVVVPVTVVPESVPDPLYEKAQFGSSSSAYTEDLGECFNSQNTEFLNELRDTRARNRTIVRRLMIGSLTGHNSVSTSDHHNAEIRFIFLSVFSWQERKGWKVLLEAFMESFPCTNFGDKRDQCDVHLVIKTTPLRPYSSTVFEARHQALEHFGSIPQNVHFYLNSERNKSTTDRHRLSASEYHSMFRAADAFVLPTHGEGWCRPCVEAMLAGLPTLVTNWSAPLDFLLPISHEGKELQVTIPISHEVRPVSTTAQEQVPQYFAMEWALPHKNALVDAMKQTVSLSPEARLRLGGAARARVSCSFNRQRVATVAYSRLKQISAELVSTAALRQNLGACPTETQKDAVLLRVKQHDKALQMMRSFPSNFAEAAKQTPSSYLQAQIFGMACKEAARQGDLLVAADACGRALQWQHIAQRATLLHSLQGEIRRLIGGAQNLIKARHHYNAALQLEPTHEGSLTGLEMLANEATDTAVVSHRQHPRNKNKKNKNKRKKTKVKLL